MVKTPKNHKEREFITCRFSEDKVNSQVAENWMKNFIQPGRERGIGKNKRTILRIFGD